MAHSIGDIINQRYEILGILGEGGTGITYSAQDLHENQKVALKVLALRQAEDWKVIELFEREALTLAQLQHPNIPTYLNYFVVDNDRNHFFYIVQELAEGKSLFQWVQEDWRCTEKEVKAIAAQVLNILDYLHSFSTPIIHRDIKPHNLIRRADGQIFLVDFGSVGSTYHNTFMRGSTVVGTFGYMAPEQFRGQAVPATDFYGLGATMLFLLTRRSPAELPTQKLKVEFRSRIQLSDTFAEWLEKCLEPAAKDRFESAMDAIASLNRPSRVKYSAPRILIPFGLAGLLLFLAVPKLNDNRYLLLNRLGLTDKAYAVLNNGNISINDFVQEYFDKGGDLNARESGGRTLIYRAIASGDLETVKKLLNLGASLQVVDDMGKTPLHMAVFTPLGEPDEQKLLSYLLSLNQVDISAKDKEGKTALENLGSEAQGKFFITYLKTAKLSKEEKTDLFNRLSKYALEKNWMQLTFKINNEVKTPNAVSLDDVAQKAFALKDSKTLQSIITSHKKLSKKFFMTSNFHEIDNVIKYDKILKLMPDIDLVDRTGSTLINRISGNIRSKEDVDALKQLIKMKADVNKTDSSGCSPLLSTLMLGGISGMEKQREAAAFALVEAGADPNYRAPSGSTYVSQQTHGGTALHLASREYSGLLIKFILQKGASLNVKDDRGATPLHMAMFNRDIEVAKILIASGAKLNAKDKSGKTPTDYPKFYSNYVNPKIIELFDPGFYSKY
jgi:serine/threonine protein kinase